ncbi:uncharacterized protein LOC127879012 isoform X2 [Dreissena polymorpha]|nr:uncharacterized protein LOC127879012 isoform X2 [Dreissena polymorpha]
MLETNRPIDNVGDPAELCTLVSTAVELFVKTVKTIPNQNQMLKKCCDMLLPVFVQLWSSNPSPTVTHLDQALAAILLHRDQSKSYEAYLKAKQGSDTGEGHVTNKAKIVETMFDTLRTLIKGENNPQMCQYLPVFYRHFILQDCHTSKPLIAHHMMMELSSVLGFNPGQSDTGIPAENLKGVNQLLNVVLEQELYILVSDENVSTTQLKYYRQLVDALLHSECMLADWYSCITSLLQLNHQIVEPRLTDVLMKCWIQRAVVSPEDISAMDTMLATMVTTYSKLRQVPKFISRLQAAMVGGTDQSLVSFPAGFLASFGEMVQSLPQGVLTEVWGLLTKALTSHIPNSSPSEPQSSDQAISGPNKGSVQGLCTIFFHFLMNVKVADYNITDVTWASVCEHMVTMETEILRPMIKEFSGEKKLDLSRLVHTLLLSLGWGEVCLLLSFYKQFRASNFQSGLVSHPNDLSLLHPYMETFDWLKLHKKIVKKGEPQLLYIWDMLVIQKVRALVLHRKQSDWASVSETIAKLFNFSDAFIITEMDTYWSGKMEHVTKETHALASWSLLLDNLASLNCVLSEQQRRDIADRVVQCLLTTTTHSPEGMMTFLSVTWQFLESPFVCDLGNLLNKVITVLWKHCRDCFVPENVNKTKKMRVGKSGECLITLLTEICSVETPWAQDMNSESLGRLTAAANQLQKLMSSRGQLSAKPDWSHVETCCQILKKFPLDELWPCDQTRILIGLFAIQVVTSSSGVLPEKVTGLQNLSLELLTGMLSGCVKLPFYQLVDVQSFLTWIEHCINTAAQWPERRGRLQLLAEVSCQMMVQENTVLKRLPGVVKQLGTSLEKQSDVGTLSVTLYILQEICKVWNQPKISDAIQSPCRQVFECLAEIVLKKSGDLGQSSHSDDVALLVRCVTAVMTSVHQAQSLQVSMEQIWPGVARWCHENLQSYLDVTNVQALLSALWFLKTSARFQLVLSGVLQQGTKLDFWNRLVQVIASLLDVQSKHAATSQFGVCGQDSDAHVSKKDEKRENRKRKANETNLIKSKTQKVSCDEDDSVKRMKDFSLILRDVFYISDTQQRENTQDKRTLVSKDISSSVNVSYSNVNQGIDYRQLVFDGRLHSNWLPLVLQQTQTTLAAILVTFDLDQFTDILCQLERDVHPGNIQHDLQKVTTTLYIWRNLLRQEFTVEQSKSVRNIARNLMLNFQCVLSKVQHSFTESMAREVTMPILQVQQQMLSLGKGFLSPQSSVLSLYSCTYAPLEGSTFFPAFQAVCHILTALLVYHTDTVFLNAPTFIKAAKRLLLAVVDHASQERLAGKTELVDGMVNCAFQMDRLFSLIATHKLEFGKLAVYVVADYVTAVQKATLLPSVKRGLVPAVYKMLDLCDRHAVAQLHTVLGHGVIEIFRLLYNDYTKFHKYTGKI